MTNVNIDVYYDCLCCGYNATGISSMLSLEQTREITNPNNTIGTIDTSMDKDDEIGYDTNVLDRILINVGDSTQRFCLENKIKLAKVSIILVTSLASHNVSGLPGMIHCLSSLGVGKITIIGPLGISTLIEIMTPFVNRRYPILDIIEIDKSYDIETCLKFQSPYFDIYAIAISPTNQENVIGITTLIKPAISRNKDISICKSLGSLSVMPYGGYFKLNKSIDEIEEWMNLYAPSNRMLVVHVPIAMGGFGCITNFNQYVDDLSKSKLGNGRLNVYFNLQLSKKVVDLKSPQLDIALYHHISPNFFRESMVFNILNQEEIMSIHQYYRDNSKLVLALPCLRISLTSFDIINLKQNKWLKLIQSRLEELSSISTSHIASTNLQKDLTSLKSENFAAASQLRERLLKRKPESNLSQLNYKEDVRVTLLGTGSAKPSKHRNNSGILLQLSKSVNILLDVGEGTCCQIYQFCSGNYDKFCECISQIRLIWISHHHADHISGFPMILQEIQRARSYLQTIDLLKELKFNKILVICSPICIKYFEFISIITGLEDICEFLAISSTQFAGSKAQVSTATDGRVIHLISVGAYHCPDAYALVMELFDHQKIVYSGDCRPNQNLIRIGLGCDLLIHEATFDDSMQEDANKKKHCTISEALNVGLSMKAGSIILTHFSQRYPLIISKSVTDDNELTQGNALRKEYITAFDMLSFNFPSQYEEVMKSTNEIVKFIEVSDTNIRNS